MSAFTNELTNNNNNNNSTDVRSPSLVPAATAQRNSSYNTNKTLSNNGSFDRPSPAAATAESPARFTLNNINKPNANDSSASPPSPKRRPSSLLFRPVKQQSVSPVNSRISGQLANAWIAQIKKINTKDLYRLLEEFEFEKQVREGTSITEKQPVPLFDVLGGFATSENILFLTSKNRSVNQDVNRQRPSRLSMSGKNASELIRRQEEQISGAQGRRENKIGYESKKADEDDDNDGLRDEKEEAFEGDDAVRQASNSRNDDNIFEASIATNFDLDDTENTEQVNRNGNDEDNDEDDDRNIYNNNAVRVVPPNETQKTSSFDLSRHENDDENTCSLDEFGFLTIHCGGRCCSCTTTTDDDEIPDDHHQTKDENGMSRRDEKKSNPFSCLIQINFYSFIVHLCLLAGSWLCLWLLFPPKNNESNPGGAMFEPGGLIFDAVVLFIVASVVGKFVGNRLAVPPLIVIFFIGLAWGNIPHYNFLTSGISSETRRVVARLALANIVLRTGLAVSVKLISIAKWNIIFMSFLPLVTEIVVHGFVAGALFSDFRDDNNNGDTSAIWPFLQGAVVAPSASGVVAAVVMILQSKGFTISRGGGILLIPACALDMTLGIWAINFVASLIFRAPDDSLALLVLLGPIQILVGAICGILLGLIWYFVCVNVICKEYLHNIKEDEEMRVAALSMMRRQSKHSDELKRKSSMRYNQEKQTFFFNKEQFDYIALFSTFALGLMAAFCIFFGYYINSAGGGCIACTLLGATVTTLLTQDPPENNNNDNTNNSKSSCWFGLLSKCNPILSSLAYPAEQLRLRAQIVHNFASLWNDVLVVLLFSFSSSSLNIVDMFDPATVGVAIATIFIGFFCRAIVTGACSYSFPHMTRSEWLICALALGGKGFTQVALADAGKSIVADHIEALSGGGNVTLLSNETKVSIEKWNRMAATITHTGAISVIFTAPIVVFLLSVVGPKYFWMTDEQWLEQEEKKEEERMNREAREALEKKPSSSSCRNDDGCQEMKKQLPVDQMQDCTDSGATAKSVADEKNNNDMEERDNINNNGCPY